MIQIYELSLEGINIELLKGSIQSVSGARGQCGKNIFRAEQQKLMPGKGPTAKLGSLLNTVKISDYM